jgi:hypothetical protein
MLMPIIPGALSGFPVAYMKDDQLLPWKSLQEKGIQTNFNSRTKSLKSEEQ